MFGDGWMRMITARRHCWSKKSAISTGNEARSVGDSLSGDPVDAVCCPPGCVFRRSGYQAQTSQANNSGDAVGSLHRLISATRGGSAPSSWSRVDRRRTGGASNHDIVALRELTAPVCPVQALWFSSVDPQTKAFSHSFPSSPGWIGKLQS